MEKTLFLAVLATLLVACEPEPTPTGPPQNIPATTATDAGPPTGTVQAVTTEFCSVKILWNFTDGSITFSNLTDQTAYVIINRADNGTQIVDATVYSRTSRAKDGLELNIGDKVDVVVEFLVPNLSLDWFKECDRKTYILGQ